MKIKRFNQFVVFLCFFCAIWSNEPVKMILSGLLLHLTIKFTWGDDKVIGKELVTRNIPVDFTGMVKRNVKP